MADTTDTYRQVARWFAKGPHCGEVPHLPSGQSVIGPPMRIGRPRFGVDNARMLEVSLEEAEIVVMTRVSGPCKPANQRSSLVKQQHQAVRMLPRRNHLPLISALSDLA